MILYVNHTRRDAAATTANEVVATVLALLEGGQIDPAQYARLRIDLDWIQYKQNFREAVMITKGAEKSSGQIGPMEVHIDSRQAAANLFVKRCNVF